MQTTTLAICASHPHMETDEKRGGGRNGEPNELLNWELVTRLLDCGAIYAPVKLQRREQIGTCALK